jgi:hypothetical protein
VKYSVLKYRLTALQQLPPSLLVMFFILRVNTAKQEVTIANYLFRAKTIYTVAGIININCLKSIRCAGPDHLVY